MTEEELRIQEVLLFLDNPALYAALKILRKEGPGSYICSIKEYRRSNLTESLRESKNKIDSMIEQFQSVLLFRRKSKFDFGFEWQYLSKNKVWKKLPWRLEVQSPNEWWPPKDWMGNDR